MIKKSSKSWVDWNLEKKKKSLTKTLEQTLILFKSGNTIEEIAKKREYKIQTIEYQIIELITLGFVNIDNVILISKKNKILEIINNNPNFSLKQIKEILSDNYSYFEIKCVLADINRNP